MVSLTDLDLLAKHAGVIFGRALDPSALSLALESPPVGAPHALTDHATEIHRALAALSALQSLALTGAAGRRAAGILLYSYATIGPPLRAQGYHYQGIGVQWGGIEIGLEPPRPVPPGGRKATAARRRDYERSKRAYNVYQTRVSRAQVRGKELYDEAIRLWQGR